MMIVCYIPGLQKVIGSTSIPAEHWFIPAAFGIALLLLDEGRKYIVRNRPQSLLARIAW
jgi:sodium/potassium-transporting ATPase subunit alpha